MPSTTHVFNDPAAPTATTSLTQSIEKLDGSMASGKSNYDKAWKFRIIHILKEKSLLSAIENYPDESNTRERAQDNTAFTHQQKMDLRPADAIRVRPMLSSHAPGASHHPYLPFHAPSALVAAVLRPDTPLILSSSTALV